MAFSKFIHIVDMIYRGNWDFSGECKIFSYFTKKLHVSRAGKALAGWSDCTMSVAAPDYSAFLNEENKVQVKNYITQLFDVGIPELTNGGTLANFRYVMLASLLMYFDEMAGEFGYNNDIIKTLIHVGHQLDIEVSTLRTWGSAVKQQFLHKNAQNLASAVGSRTGFSIVLQELLMERDHHREMIADLKSDVKHLTMMVESLLATAPTSPALRHHKRTIDELESPAYLMTGSSSSTKVEPPINESTVPLNKKVEQKNAFEVIVSESSRKRGVVHFPNILKMTISELVKQVIIQGVNMRVEIHTVVQILREIFAGFPVLRTQPAYLNLKKRSTVQCY